jgi:hypothetical protein
MNVKCVSVAALLATITMSRSMAAAPPAPLQISVSKQAVTVSNVSNAGAIVLFSCARVSLSRSIAVRPSAVVLRDDAHSGTIRFTPPGGVPLRSVWIAVDEASGQIASSARSEFALSKGSIGPENLPKDVEGEIAALAIQLPRLIVLLVRPGTGAWVETVFDGEKGDRDGVGNGRVQLSFEDFQILDGKEKPPKHLKKDDAVVAVDPGHLNVFAVQIAK